MKTLVRFSGLTTTSVKASLILRRIQHLFTANRQIWPEE